MLKIFDKNHNAVGRLVKYKDSKVESDVTTGDKTLSFVYLAKHHHLENEMYIRTKSDEYVIKEISETSDGFPEVIAALNLEELESKPWREFSVTDSTVDEAARVAIAGTGWTIGICDVNKRRNAGMVQVTSLGIIQNLCVAFMCEPVFDTIRKQISFFEKRGENKGVYFLSGLNLKKLQKKSTTYDFYTRIVPIGADGLTIESVNGGKSYLENYQYSSKVKTYIWKDESYTDAQALKEDAEKRLDDLSKPEKSYSADVRDLARQNPKYAILSYGLGDTIRLIDRNTGTMEDQRIMHMTEYESDPEKNTCEIANTFLTFEELQEKMQAAANIVNYTISNDGKIKVSDILKFEQGIADSPVIGGINSSITNMQGDIAKINLTVGQIETNYLKAEEADLKYATIQRADILEADINSLRGEYGDFKTLTTKEFAADRALIGAIQGDLADYKTVVAGELIAAKGWMAEGSIGSAQISDVNANKITAGTLNTAMVDIAGTDGRLQISDNTIQIKDANRVRVQVGKDSSGDYTLAVWDASGKLIWDALGATENTIQRKIIRDKMVADDAAIQALKIDFQSFETALTQQGVIISGTVVQVGNKTLNVALSEQTQIITEQGETLTEHAAKIAANENAIKLKVSTSDFSTYKTTVTGQINNAKAAAISTAAEDATTKANSALADAKTYTNAQITTVNSHLTTIDSSIDVLQNQIALKVEQTDIDTAVMTAKNYTDASMAQKKDSIYFSTSGTPGQTGYFFLATIKITGNYQNQPIKIGIINRNRQQSTCWIQFANLNGTDPGIASFQMIGTALFYLYKASASNWHLYVQKSESYDNLSVVEFEKAPYMNNTLVTWNSTQLSSLPSGYISATKLAGMYTVDNTSGGVSGSDSLITSGAVYQTKTEITAAYRSEINITKDSITSAVSQTYATKSELSTANGKITGLETWKTEASQKITKDGIIATVGNYYAYQSDLEAAKNRITAAESTILQQADQISLRVQKDGIISAINQTAETVKINAGKVNLTGYVTMTNLATAGQTTINGANIKTGTISADRIDVNGLFAKEITATGTITGVNLVGAKGSFSGSITASSGTIGGWNIGSNDISSKNASGNYVYLVNGTNPNQDVLVVRTGAGTTASPYSWPVIIRANGQTYFSNANIDGSIHSTSMIADYNISMKTYGGATGKLFSTGESVDLYNSVFFNMEGVFDSLYLQVPFVQASGDLHVFGDIHTADGIYSSKEISAELTDSIAQFRAVYGDYGFMIRNDGVNSYFLLTNSGNQYGTWNSLRPMIINNFTGSVRFEEEVEACKNINLTANTTSRARIRCKNNNNEVELNATTNAGVYHSGATGSETGKWLIYINTAGTVAANTSDRRWKVDAGYLKEEEAAVILRETSIINFVYKEDIGHYNLEQSGVYAQDLRDTLLRNGYKNRGYIGVVSVMGDDNISYDLTLPETGVRYEIDYTKFVPVLWKGWQYHDKELKTIASHQNTQESRIELLQQQLNEAMVQILQQAAELVRLRGMMQASA